MNDELRIPHLVGGPLEGRPAPAEWVEDRVEQTARFAEYLYADPPEDGFQDIPIAISRENVHEYVEESLTIGGRHADIAVVEHGVEAQRVRALIHKPIQNKALWLVRTLFELAGQSVTRASGDSGSRLFGHEAHLILANGEHQVEVEDWLTMAGPHDNIPAVNASRVLDVIHDEEKAGRW